MTPSLELEQALAAGPKLTPDSRITSSHVPPPSQLDLSTESILLVHVAAFLPTLPFPCHWEHGTALTDRLLAD
jgi:hypothetical protein